MKETKAIGCLLHKGSFDDYIGECNQKPLLVIAQKKALIDTNIQVITQMYLYCY